MGINTDWPDRLGRIFGWPELSADDGCKIDFILDDMELNVRRLFGGAETWTDVATRAVNRITIMLNAPAASAYYVLFDDSRYVPRNKSIEQGLRNQTAVPFTDKEQQDITVGVTPIPMPSADFFSRFMVTRPLRTKLRIYLAMSLCKVKLAVGKKIVVDAVIPRGIVAASGDGYMVTNVDDFAADGSHASAASAAAAAAVASLGLDVDVGGGASLDIPTTVTITSREDGTGNDVHISTTGNKIGEGDFKIPYWISKCPSGSRVYVRSYDTDTFPIMLLHMRRWCESTFDDDGKPIGNIRYKIFVDTNSPVRATRNPRPVLDMVQFYTNIMVAMMRSHPWIKHPMEMFCTVLLLCGSDYLKLPVTDSASGDIKYLANHRSLGPSTVWDAFNHPTCREILYPRRMESLPPVKIESIVDDVTSPIHIQIDETRIYNFIAFMHHKVIFKEWASITLFRDKRYDYTLARSRSTMRTLPMPERDIYVFVRQLAWNLGYLVNGSSSMPFDDPFAVTPDSTSIYGWHKVQVKDVENVRITSTVTQSPFLT